MEKVYNPFERFPKEIWERLLDQMEDSKDILSVLRGLPQLDISIDTQKRFWYIGQILPCLYGIIDLGDVLNLRLVCKQWQRCVDSFLQNQPCYRAYSEELDKDKSWVFFDEFLSKSFEKCTLHVRTDQDEGVSQKLDEIMEHPPTRNPFVFREIAVDMKGTDDELEKVHLTKIISGLEQFGTHVWYFTFSMISPVGAHQIKVLIKLLQHTPNLKSLKIFIQRDYLSGPQDISYKDAELLEKNLPELSLLETLEISPKKPFQRENEFYSFKLVRSLVKRYGAQIRRFVVPLHSWKAEEFASLFPQLTELQLEVCSGDYHALLKYKADFKELAILRNLLSNISSTRLVKLILTFFNVNGIFHLSVEEDILKWLKQFTSIKYFAIRGCCHINANPTNMIQIQENNTSDPIKDCIPSLVTLKLPVGHGHSLSYNFLLCFPSLRQLEMIPFCCPTVVDFSVPDPVKLREQIQTGKLYESNIWKLLSKLREVTITMWTVYIGGDRFYWYTWRYHRETFEQLNKAGRIPVDLQLYPFRRDIIEFMNYFRIRESPFDFNEYLVLDETENNLDEFDREFEEYLETSVEDFEMERNEDWELFAEYLKEDYPEEEYLEEEYLHLKWGVKKTGKPWRSTLKSGGKKTKKT